MDGQLWFETGTKASIPNAAIIELTMIDKRLKMQAISKWDPAPRSYPLCGHTLNDFRHWDKVAGYFHYSGNSNFHHRCYGLNSFDDKPNDSYISR